MAPPTYSDLGKSARDLFSKGYNFGFLKVEATTKVAKDNIEFKPIASHNTATGKLFGSLDVKYKIPEYGVTLTEKWNTDNTLGTEIQVQDRLAKGVKLTFDSSFAPQLGKRTGKIKAEYKHDRVSVNSDVTLEKGPIVNTAAVFGWEGWLIGLHSGFDAQKNKLTHTNLAFGRSTGAYTLHTFINDQSEFGGSLYHKVNDKLELGVNLGWTTGEQATRFGLAAKYQVDKEWTVRAKVSSASQLCLAMTHQLNDHVKMTISSLINMQNFQEGGHKFGVGIEYEPCC